MKNDLRPSYIERKYLERRRTGWCKVCRQWDLLIDDTCFDCLGLRLTKRLSGVDRILEKDEMEQLIRDPYAYLKKDM